MTKKDYELIAKVFAKNSADKTIGQIERSASQAVAFQMAYVLGRNNSKFDKPKFLRACGLSTASIARDRVVLD